MTGRTTGQAGATQLLAQLMASIEADLSADAFEALDGGVACVIHLESGDRYRVLVQ